MIYLKYSGPFTNEAKQSSYAQMRVKISRKRTGLLHSIEQRFFFNCLFQFISLLIFRTVTLCEVFRKHVEGAGTSPDFASSR